jgi:micrococcal nuclease
MFDAFQRPRTRRAVALLLWLVVLVPVWAAAGTAAKTFVGEVVGVHDGDTLEVMHEGRAVKIRLYGIDTPESGQAFGTVARQFTAGLVHRQQVRVVVEDTDRYGRLVAEVQLPDGRNLNAELVRAGLAWWYRQYAPKDTTLARLETEARSTGRGLWRDPQAQAPWEYRAQEQRTKETTGTASAPAPRTTRTDPGTREIHTGPRGGRYYLTDHGTKVYVPRK